MIEKIEDLELDENMFELEILLHYLRIPLETLKRRLQRAKSSTSKYLIGIAIEFGNQKREEEKK